MTSRSVSTGRVSAIADLSCAERQALDGLAEAETPISAGQSIRATWSIGPSLQFLHEGWAASSIVLPGGGTQIAKLHLPGDIMGLASLPFERAADSLIALTKARVGLIRLERLTALFASHPRLSALLFLVAQEDQALLTDHLVAVGRFSAKDRVVALLLDLHHRLGMVDRARQATMEIPLTQRQLGDVVGLTAVHVNRVLQQLEAEGEIRRRGRMVELVDVVRLHRLALLPRRGMTRNPSWLPAASAIVSDGDRPA